MGADFYSIVFLGWESEVRKVQKDIPKFDPDTGKKTVKRGFSHRELMIGDVKIEDDLNPSADVRMLLEDDKLPVGKIGDDVFYIEHYTSDGDQEDGYVGVIVSELDPKHGEREAMVDLAEVRKFIEVFRAEHKLPEPEFFHITGVSV